MLSIAMKNPPFLLISFTLLCIACIGDTYCQIIPDSRLGLPPITSLSILLTGEGYVELPIKRTVTGQWIVNARFRNRKLAFLIDTGANRSAINKQIADSLQFPVVTGKRAKILRIDSSATTSFCIAESLFIGNMLVEPLEMVVNSSMFTQMNEAIQKLRYNPISNPWGYMDETEVIDAFDGVLGNDFLLRYSTIIDMRSNKIYLKHF